MFGRFVIKKQMILVLLSFSLGLFFSCSGALEKSRLLGQQLIYVLENQSHESATLQTLPLVTRGADIHLIDDLNRHALLIARQKNMVEACSILTEYGAYIPLCLAIGIGRYSTKTVLLMIKELNESGRHNELNRPDSNGETPVHLACYAGIDKTVLRALAHAGANLNPKGRYHPLEIAKKDESKTHILLEGGAMINPNTDISWSDLLFGCSERWKMKTKKAEKYNRQ